MAEYVLDSAGLSKAAKLLRAGDRVLLSGTVYTARDAAHKRLVKMIKAGEKLPFEIAGASIYYAGPTPAPPGFPIGSCGPTTSSRMDPYAPLLYSMGLASSIGKGPRSDAVIEAIVKNSAVYLCAVGGAGALAARCVTSCEVIAFDDLGCESVKRLEFDSFPLTVGADCAGNTAFV